MSNKKEPYVLVCGVSVYDIIGFSCQKFKSQDSNPGRVKVSYGGVCRNIAENMARLGVNTKFISILGDDEKGKSMLQHAKCLKLDMTNSMIVKGETTPTYMAILNEHGEMEAAIVDMKITDKMTTEFIDTKAELIKNANYMVLDTDNPLILEYILTTYEGCTKFILDPVSATKVSKVKHLIHKFHTIKPNRFEAEELCGFKIETKEDVKKAGKYFLDLGIQSVFISLDEDGIYYTNGIEDGIIKAKHVSAINVTGAGDSCVAGLCYGYMNNLTLKEMVKWSIAMSVLTITHEETIHPQMSCELVGQCIEQIDWWEE